MITVYYGDKMQEAFAAGEAAAMTRFAKSGRLGKAAIDAFNAPQTYDEWIASKADEPAIVRG